MTFDTWRAEIDPYLIMPEETAKRAYIKETATLIEQLQNPSRLEGGHLDEDKVTDLMRIAAFALDTMIGVASKAAAREITEDHIKHMVNRFLGWKLPNNFNPDFGISYTRPNYPESVGGPSGTNLLDADQSDAMVRYLVEGLPVPREMP